MEPGFSIWILVPLVLSTNLLTLAQTPNEIPVVDRVFLKQLFRPQLEWMSKYTLESCWDLGVEFNISEAINDFNVCINKKLMPRVVGRTHEYFARTRETLEALRKMENLKDFLPWKDELEKMCDIIPDLSNCFLHGFVAWINGCWEFYYRSSYGYLNNLSRSLCNSQKGIRGLFTPKYLPCLDKYAKSVKHCVRQSHLHFGSLCGLIPCLQQFVPKCGILRVDDFLSRIFATSQKHSDCPTVPYIFPIEALTTTAIPTEETAILLSPVIETTPETNLEEPNNSSDACTILEEKLEILFQNDTSEPARFFNFLDSICANWSESICHERPVESGWTPFLTSQCTNSLSPALNGTTDRCVGSAFDLRVEQLNTFCSDQRADGFPGMGESGCNQVVEALRNSSSGGIESESSNDIVNEILDECSRKPSSAAARQAEATGPLIWGLIVVPLGILLIAILIHYMTQRREASGQDVGSGDSLLSIDTKVTSSQDTCTIEL